MKSFLACLFSAVLLGSVNAADDKIDAREFRVYEAVLSDPSYLRPNILLLVFNDQTEAPSRIFGGCKTPEEFAGVCEANNFKVDHTLVAQFFENNQKACPLPKEFRFGFDVEIKTISAEQQKAIFVGDIERGWKSFYRAYPNCSGIITVSRVAYSEAGDMALVYIGESSGSLAGNGCLHLLKHDEHGWKEVSQFITWMS